MKKLFTLFIILVGLSFYSFNGLSAQSKIGDINVDIPLNPLEFYVLEMPAKQGAQITFTLPNSLTVKCCCDEGVMYNANEMILPTVNECNKVIYTLQYVPTPNADGSPVEQRADIAASSGEVLKVKILIK